CTNGMGSAGPLIRSVAALAVRRSQRQATTTRREPGLNTMSISTITLNPSLDQSLSVARVIAERKLVGEDVRLDPGGGGINVARVVTRLGGQVRAWWSRGGDNGRRLAQLLEGEGVVHTAVPVAGEVRQNL